MFKSPRAQVNLAFPFNFVKITTRGHFRIIQSLISKKGLWILVRVVLVNPRLGPTYFVLHRPLFSSVSVPSSHWLLKRIGNSASLEEGVKSPVPPLKAAVNILVAFTSEA